MEHYAVKGFIKALKLWSEKTKEKDGIKDVIFILHFKLGTKSMNYMDLESTDEILKTLEDRILYLIQIEKLDEIFLVTSIIQELTNYFIYRIKSLGESIITNEVALNSNNERLIEIVTPVIKRLKSIEYRINIKNDYYRWKEIIAQELSEEIFEQWEREILIKQSGKVMEQGKLLKDKYGNITLKEIREIEKGKIK